MVGWRTLNDSQQSTPILKVSGFLGESFPGLFPGDRPLKDRSKPRSSGIVSRRDAADPVREWTIESDALMAAVPARHPLLAQKHGGRVLCQGVVEPLVAGRVSSWELM